MLEPICRKLKIKHLIASNVDKRSGEYSGVNCHGKEKVKRFYREFGNGKINRFYSDSKSDTPLAKLADKAFIVKKNKITEWNFDR